MQHRFVILLGLVIALNLSAANDKPGIDILSMPISEAVQTLKNAYQSDAETVDNLTAEIAENVSKSRPIIEALESSESTTAQTLYAELLVRCARGIEVAPWNRAGRELDKLTVNEIGSRAIVLIHHPDPFICALAEWAIDIRVGMLNGTIGKQNYHADFDNPTLKELWRTAPYRHNGSAATLYDVLRIQNRQNKHGATAHLSNDDINEFVYYFLCL